MQPLTPEAAADAARRVLDPRIAVVRELAKARAEVGHAESALAAAEQADAAAYSDALRAGWTEAELRKVGLAPSKRRTAGRPRRARQTPPDTPASGDGAGAAANG